MDIINKYTSRSGTWRKNSETYAKIQTVGIIGAGQMGVEIAAANVRCGFPVAICDTDRKTLETVKRRVALELADLESEDQIATALELVTPCQFSRLENCNLIIEAISEDLKSKIRLVHSLEPMFSPGMIFVSNTSSIPIHKIADEFPFRKNIAGLHFLHPVRNRELVEIITTERSGEALTHRLCDYVLSLEKTPLCVGDCPGFAVNRLLQPYLSEALSLLQDGVPMESIEKAALRFGWEWGPLRFMDEIGLDIVWHSGRVLYEAYPELVVPSPILVTMMKRKFFGRKSGCGFYEWGEPTPENVHDHRKQPGEFNPEARAVVEQWHRMEEPMKLTLQEIAGRLATAMALEGSRLIVQDVLSEQGQVDMAAVIGLGFPEAKHGPLAWFTRELKEP